MVAVIQVNSDDDPERNFARAEALARRAKERGACLVVFPENLLYEGSDKGARHDPASWGPRFGALARELEITLIPGSQREPAGERAYNTCLVYGPDGAELARYRKAHLFDVDVPGGHAERESSYIAPGEPDPVVVEVPGVGPVGLSICYDLRFPTFFRRLVDAGARTIVLPASFALGTGKDHWLTLLKARAIENQVYLLAPDQFGKKPHGRFKYGKSAIIDPWGSVLGLAPDVDEAIVISELDFAYQDQVRRALPCLTHRRI
ncbi:MAG: carbon-nitrogen hydrolase family protein [Planctomycetes bacterium]|nr:carbon-nitrogen hydrolase family protein [Planctomycetota bacterium]